MSNKVKRQGVTIRLPLHIVASLKKHFPKADSVSQAAKWAILEAIEAKR